MLSGGTPKTSKQEYWNGSIPWITASALKGFFLNDSLRRLTEVGVENGSRLVPEGTTICVVRGMSLRTEFRLGITTRPVAFGEDCKALIPDEGIDPTFFAYALKSREAEVLALVDRAGHGTGRLGTPELKSVSIPVPPVPEQRRIASALKMVQELAQQTKGVSSSAVQLKESLRTHLFTFGLCEPSESHRIETAPLGPGKAPTQWSRLRIGEIAEVVRGSSPRPKGNPLYFSREPTEYPWIMISDLRKFKKGKLLTATSEYLTKEGMRKGRHIPAGTLVLTNSGTVGVPAILGISGCIHDGYLAFRDLDTDRVNREFLYYLLEYWTEYLLSIAPKGTQANLNTRIVKGLQIALPPISTQAKIAALLEAADRKIELEEQLVHALSQLFDSLLIELMSGKTRIPQSERAA